ncbi:hypothetical protein NHX12_006765, partial [Muraenolepis orangiensis]
AESWLELDGLQRDSSYTVELQAVTYWGQGRLKSPKASLQFLTSQNNDSVKSVPKPKKEDIPPVGSASKRPAGALEVGTPFYQDGQLQVRLYWKNRGEPDPTLILVHLFFPDPVPRGVRSALFQRVIVYQIRYTQTQRGTIWFWDEMCSMWNAINVSVGWASVTQENYINLPGLLFSCKYKVTVHTLKPKRRSKDETTTFLTPSCATLRSKTQKHIPCPGEGGQ